jgi:hypothetical protein
MNLIDFFEDENDLVESIKDARDYIMPILQSADDEIDPIRGVKIQTAIFILMTVNAVNMHGLTKRNAIRIISNLIDAINSGKLDRITH